MKEQYIDYSNEVEAARAAGKPVVALESTIISHGMPFPQNLDTAAGLEELIRKEGAAPATIAILGGRVKIGLSPDELEHLSRAKDILKASRRDVPAVIAGRRDAATTVAATMLCAELGGIRVFATGGIGGVHRGGEKSLDISADLEELGRTSVAVVCAGAKAILDIGRTLEYLETRGVPVIGYATNDFPAFYTRESGFTVDYRLDSPRDIANLMKAKWDLGLSGGVLIGNPVPEADAADKETIDRAITRALSEAQNEGIHGKGVTPYLLSRLVELTEGKSLVTNIALVRNNARLAARIAAAYAREAS